MNNRPSGRSLRLASAVAVSLSTCTLSAHQLIQPLNPQSAIHNQQSLASFTFAHEGILGTSMDLILHAENAADAEECHRQIQSEIERLRQILSTYDPASEISQYMAGGPIQSPELSELLEAYQQWNTRTGGAIDSNMAGVIALWKSAIAQGQQPSSSALQQAHAAPLSLNIDALGKGYIIDQAVSVARQFARAGLLNIGGDLRAWGPQAFQIGIADPTNPAENAEPIATFNLHEAAAATSASYARYQLPVGLAASAASGFANQKISHLINPRTLTPADPRNAATIIATDCLTANALSTTACVIEPHESVALANTHAQGYLITSRAGTFENLPTRTTNVQPVSPINQAATAPWPKDFQVSINLTLKVARGGKVKRPYVAVWIEDAKGKPVRSITIWGTQPKYFRELSEWWNATKGDQKLLRSITRATREPGQYTVAWDGKDDAGNPLPKGDYTVKVEINREHGRHVGELAKLTCQDKKITATLKATAESEESTVTYGPK